VNLVKDSPRFSSSQEALTVVMKLNDEDGFLDNVVFHCQSLRCDRYGRSRRDWYNSRGHAQSAQAPSRANNSNKVYRLPSESSLRFENYEEHLYFLLVQCPNKLTRCIESKSKHKRRTCINCLTKTLLEVHQISSIATLVSLKCHIKLDADWSTNNSGFKTPLIWPLG